MSDNLSWPVITSHSPSPHPGVGLKSMRTLSVQKIIKKSHIAQKKKKNCQTYRYVGGGRRVITQPEHIVRHKRQEMKINWKKNRPSAPKNSSNEEHLGKQQTTLLGREKQKRKKADMSKTWKMYLNFIIGTGSSLAVCSVGFPSCDKK